MKKIYFNATILNNKPTGLGIYTINVLERLDKYNIIDTVIFNNKTEEQRYLYLIKNAQVTNINNNKSKFRAFYRNYLMNKYVKENLGENDIVYSPTQHGVKVNRIKQVITIHDLIPVFYPKGRIHQYVYYKFVIPKLLKNCSKVITISQNTKIDILKNYKITSNKVDVVYNGYSKPKFLDRLQSSKYIYEKYKIKDYLLMVGINYEYKNLHSVINAYGMLKGKINNKLVIVGNDLNAYGKKLVKLVEKLGLKKDVLFLGYVDDDDLEKLYQAAKIFIYPSLYEGFGLPILEAASNGTLVISSNYSCIPEIAKDIAILIDTKNVSEIAECILRNINNANFKINKKRLYRFDWELTVKQIMNILVDIGNEI